MTTIGSPRPNAGRKRLSSTEPTRNYVIRLPVSIADRLRGRTIEARATLTRLGTGKNPKPKGPDT